MIIQTNYIFHHMIEMDFLYELMLWHQLSLIEIHLNNIDIKSFVYVT